MRLPIGPASLRPGLGAAVLSLATAGWLLAGAQDPGASKGDDPKGGGSSSRPETRLAIAHGLAMAIEAASLHDMAQRGAPIGYGGGRNPSAGTPTGGGPGAGPVGRSGTSGDGSTAGFGIGSPGAVGGGAVGSPLGGTTGSAVLDAAGPGALAAEARAASDPRTALGAARRRRAGLGGDGATSQELQRHALEAFNASDRLLGESGATRENDRFYAAAERYAGTLRTLTLGDPGARAAGNRPANRPGAPIDTANNRNNGAQGDPAASVERPVAPPVADPGAVALLNFGVKEALDAMQLRLVADELGASDSQPARALRAHAREMERSSRQIVEMFAAKGNGSGNQGARAGGNDANAGRDRDANGQASSEASITLLARQAREVLDAIQPDRGEGDRKDRQR